MIDHRLRLLLFTLARLRSPAELCGLVFPGDQFIETANRAQHPLTEFLIDHHEYVEVRTKMGENPWALVHSHPTRDAAPSVKDCLLMDALDLAHQDLMMVIVGLQPEEIRIFKKRGDLYHLHWCWPPAS